MKALSFLIVCIALASCVQGGQQYQVRKLPSGREVRLVSVMPIRFQNGETSLMLTYQTPLKVGDSVNLRAEVRDIWATFRTDAEKAHVQSAIISAVEVPSGFILKKSTGHNFVFERAADGSWHML